jgi:hypothetical protein
MTVSQWLTMTALMEHSATALKKLVRAIAQTALLATH